MLMLLGMALVSSAAHAGPLCTAGGDASASPLCDLAASGSPPPGVDSTFLYDKPVELSSFAGAQPSSSSIVLAGSTPMEQAPAGGLLLGRVWSVTDYDEASLASTR